MLDGAPLTPRGINAAGHVVGLAAFGEGSRHAFVIDGQPAHGLGTLGGTSSEANAINGRGEIVGTSLTVDSVSRAFVYTAATGVNEIGSFDGGPSFAYGINTTGQITGYSGADLFRAFRYTADAGMTDLDTLGGYGSFGYGINDAGHVTGCSWTPDGTLHAFVWPGTGPLQDLGTLGGTQSCGVAITSAGVVAGWSLTAQDQNQHAIRYSLERQFQDLGTLGGLDSAARAVSDDGAIVGWSTNASGDRRAFMFTDGNGMIDLNDRIDPALGWTLVDASGINAAGEITGIGMLSGTTRAFRLTLPPEPEPTPEPEPPGDTTPPAIRRVRLLPDVLWPPRRQMIPVRVSVVARDDTDPKPACRVVSVTSSEPDEGTSRLDRPHDSVVRRPLSLRLRAELGPRTSERVYTVVVACTDAAGNEATATSTVRVPRTLRPPRGRR